MVAALKTWNPVNRRPAHSGAGLCDSCRHQRLVPNTRGSVFSLCERSREDPDYPRYPPIPVLRCAGFEAEPGPKDPALPR
jgi:hypothetical protein